jgi:hypothetical protein
MKKFPLILLWVATIWAAAWFGGQLFNALMVVPHFSRNPPQSLVGWAAMRFDNLADFFVVFAPIWPLVLSFIAFFFAKGSAARPWILTTAGLALVCNLILSWMVPTIMRINQPDHGGLDGLALRSLLGHWIAMNWVRLTVDFLIFVTAMRALTLANASSEQRQPLSRN